MKYFILIFVLIGLVLVAGCSSAPDENQPLSQDQQTIQTQSPEHGVVAATTTGTIGQTLPITPRATAIPTQYQTVQSNPGTFCGEMVTCGGLSPSSGVKAVPSTRCPQIVNLVIRHDPRVIQCFKNAYTGSPTAWTKEYVIILCGKGVGSQTSCAQSGVALQPVQRK